MTTSPKLGLPLIDNQQSTPEVTHNAAIMALQALALGAVSITNTPPGSPADGDTYIIGTSPTGVWSGKASKIATYYGGWIYLPGVDSDGAAITMGATQNGLSIWLVSANALYYWNGTVWGAA